MPKTIKQDTGMLEREALSYEPHELAEIVDKIINTDFSFDVIWEENRKVCLSILEHAGVRSQVEPSWNPGFLDKRFDEKSSVYIATMFLQNHSRLHKYLHQFTTGSLKTVDLIHLIHHAEEMGKFQERMRWRCGIDPLTKKSPETLALGKRKQEMSVSKAAEQRRQNAKNEPPEWWDKAIIKAKELRQKNPTWNISRVAKKISDEMSYTERKTPRTVHDVIKSLWK